MGSDIVEQCSVFFQKLNQLFVLIHQSIHLLRFLLVIVNFHFEVELFSSKAKNDIENLAPILFDDISRETLHSLIRTHDILVDPPIDTVKVPVHDGERNRLVSHHSFV